ncbi:DEAD-box ATP-dependent RNA helicase 13 [Andrographis paniculata]|uniref:DEAD-box ATP-dependent RNA helicase 13 n=1 Tax=Andrographis paniculata TaxID=175694 RepID=UPI0021E6E0C4|nr:DEAD-box ATP-dependent RNA helicase 13 [Andrographis paniculata]XP_051124877.1 DEAD-box ATP-dependent RNA helicase 13 [Andrographis paniculata]XP_051124878.1 DEAD-box ATP-dependent RNA helicase 13 [Andrographis paniculata]
MSTMASAGSSERKKTKRSSRKRAWVESEQQLERLNSLPWSSSLPESNGGEDDFSLFMGSNELEGGFLGLEEIDESEYGLEIPGLNVENETSKLKRKTKSKKHKINEGDVDDSSSGEPYTEHGIEAGQSKGNENDEKKDRKPKRKKKKKKKTDNNKRNDHQENASADEEAKQTTDTDGKDNDIGEEDPIDEEEYYAWNGLRLHPMIMKSIYNLKFKEPTPIQKACIPAAAHQGKDVIGAAETGSGKTLAFGLPILQRLLEEQDKVERVLTVKGEANERIAPHGVLRALIVTPTRELALQVTDHLKMAALGTKLRVVPIVGGMSTEKQERLLKSRPEIVVGTPGRLWELMSGGEIHLVELHSLSFFVLDEADRMIETGHFRELQSIIDMLPTNRESNDQHAQNTQSCMTVANVQRKKRQTFVFSATLGLSANFRKKLKHGSLNAKKDELNSIETLSERAGMRANVAIVDLTNASILVNKLMESVLECREEEKEAYLYYILNVHGQGRTIVFCTSIAALRRISSLLCILKINVWTLHSEMQQRARLKSVDRFRENEHGILVATDAAARGLDIPGVRTVVHFQLPLSAEVYVHRCGRTARASSDGCSIALISPTDASRFAALCNSFSKESFQRFPVESSYLPEIKKRLSLAHQIDKIVRKESQEKAEKNWLERNAESIELVLEENDSEEERVKKYRQKKSKSNQLNKLQQELNTLLSKPLQSRTFSRRYLAGAGVTPLLQQQFEELARQKPGDGSTSEQIKRRKLVVIGQDCVEPLQALKSASNEECLDLKEIAEKRKNLDNLRRKRKEQKKRLHEQRRKQRKMLKQNRDGPNDN